MQLVQSGDVGSSFAGRQNFPASKPGLTTKHKSYKVCPNFY
ncbi:MAG: hypothetical protein N2201_03440 [candidate division WOR-3 bacterium]|nr:hypothetical protein [candidate division WOR-3 bacterium]